MLRHVDTLLELKHVQLGLKIRIKLRRWILHTTTAKYLGKANSGIYVRVPYKQICKNSTKYSTVHTTFSGIFTIKYPTIEVRFGMVFCFS